MKRKMNVGNVYLFHMTHGGNVERKKCMLGHVNYLGQLHYLLVGHKHMSHYRFPYPKTGQ